MMKWVIGIDEVGRGALAGPVVVAAAAIPKNFRLKKSDLVEFGELKDSKKLSASQREKWAEYFKKHSRIRFVLARIYPRRIEVLNISGAANLAAFRAMGRLSRSIGISLKDCEIYLDGGLFLKSKKDQIERVDIRRAQTIIKGDEKIPAIAIASIVAKVARDRFMRRLAKKYAAYGFDVHKGYATAAHRKAIAHYGPAAVHRLTFLGAKYRI